MELMVNVKTVIKKFHPKDWRFIQLLKTAWTANRVVFGLLIISLIIVLDQALKYLTITNKNPFTDSFICNSGISFGLSLNLVLFWFFWFLALFVLSFLVKKFKNFFLLLALAGALSNLIDRLLLGCVIDYISILNFPVFNLADFFISFGFLAFLVFFKK